MIYEPRIIFEDDALVVIDKPGGVVVNKAETTKEGETIQEWHWQRIGLKEKGEGEFWDKQGVVHRLDKDTSGVMVLAKTEAAYGALKQQFLERKSVKRYLALIHGKMNEGEGMISAPIERHPKNRYQFSVGNDLSRMAVTDWKMIEQVGDFSLMELTPHTGRTHQLRVHMKHLGHPIAGDPIYGWKKQMKDEARLFPRLFLHAKYLEFSHPISGERVIFEADLSADLQEAYEKIAR